MRGPNSDPCASWAWAAIIGGRGNSDPRENGGLSVGMKILLKNFASENSDEKSWVRKPGKSCSGEAPFGNWGAV